MKFKDYYWWIDLLTVIVIIVVIFVSNLNFSQSQQRKGLLYSFRQENKTFYKVNNDPVQVKRDYPTPNNMFYWLNSKNGVKFRLWTRKNPELAHEIKFNNPESLKSSNFDKRKLTKMIIHGYIDGANEIRIGDWMIFMRDKYLEMSDVNLLIVDYAFHALVSLYYTSRPETVGMRVAEMIKFFISQGVPLNSFHLIGWSWGAQVAGIAGHELKGQLQRITGLDPAGPGFRFLDNEFRLDKSDAKFVDIFHTNGGTRVFWGGHYGHHEVLGHVDVFFNGGERQNGCPRHRTWIFETLWCNHGRAPAYFIETIQSPLAFPTCLCDSLDNYVNGNCPCTEDYITYAGEHMPHSTRGTFHIITKSGKPFGQGPLMNVSLPNLKFQKIIQLPLNSTSETIGLTTTNQTMDTAVIKFNNKKYKILFRNTFNVKEYPNDDILRMALMVVENFKKQEKKFQN